LVVAEDLLRELEPLREAVERLSGARLAAMGDTEPEGRFVRMSVRGREARLRVPEGFDPGPPAAARRRRLDDTRSKLGASERKLANEDFVARAAAEAVDRERRKREE